MSYEAPGLTVHEMTYVGGFLGLDVSLSAPVSYIDMSSGIWFDAARKILYTRSAAISVPGRSYEKWLLLKLTRKPEGTSFLWNFRFWVGNPEIIPAGTTLRVGGTLWMTRVPTMGESPIATEDIAQYTAENKGTWPGIPLMGQGWNTYPLVLQLEVASDYAQSDAGLLNATNLWLQTPLIILYSFDEV